MGRKHTEIIGVGVRIKGVNWVEEPAHCGHVNEGLECAHAAVGDCMRVTLPTSTEITRPRYGAFALKRGHFNSACPQILFRFFLCILWFSCASAWQWCMSCLEISSMEWILSGSKHMSVFLTVSFSFPLMYWIENLSLKLNKSFDLLICTWLKVSVAYLASVRITLAFLATVPSTA